MADIKWIKITVDIFDDEKIKLIDCLPDRDCILVVWFKLLALTGKKNETGLLFMTPKMPYTDEMLATIFNRPLNSVRLALKTFTDFGMIEIQDDKVINVLNWEKHQNIDGMDKIRDQNKDRQKRFRDNQQLKRLSLESNSNVTVTLSNGTDKEEEKSKSKKKNKKNAIADFPFSNWKKDFAVYQGYIKDGFSSTMNDEYKKTLSNDHPTLDVLATIQKAYEYWKSIDGWDKKRTGRPKFIDFKKTIRAILRQEFNHVYKGKPQYKQQNMFNDSRPQEVILNYDR